MQRDFRYLRDKYGDAGAREIFEKLCTNLLQAQHGEDAHNIRVSQGDEGIDILVGDFQFPIDNYQCKYFIDGIGSSQKAQIEHSFDRAIHSENYSMQKWILCVPCSFSSAEYDSMIFVKKLENAKIEMIDGCKRDFFNAECVEYIIESKGDSECIRLLQNLKRKVYEFWETQYCCRAFWL